MNGRFTFWLARHLMSMGGSRYARMRLLRSMLLIAIVMVPLILALIFMDGMMQGITEKYITLQDGHLQIHHADELPADLFASDGRILSADHVAAGYGIIYSRDATAEVRIKGVDDSYFNEQRTAQMAIEGAPLVKEGTIAIVMLSKTTARALGVSVGQRVAFMVVPDSSVAAVRPVLAQVVALYESGYHELDSSLVFMNREDALRFFPKEQHAYTEILVKRSAMQELASIASDINRKALASLPYATWDEFNSTVYQNFITSRQVILLVFMMILLVAGVYVSSIAQELVQDSMQSIALLKTLGARFTMILGSYYVTVMSVTAMGMALGVGAALAIGKRLGPFLRWLGRRGFSALEYYLLDFPVIISWVDIGKICLAMLILSSLTVQFSLRRIKRISPLELLQQD